MNTSDTLKMINEMKIAIENIAKKHGLTIMYKGGSFDDISFSPNSEWEFLFSHIKSNEKIIALFEKAVNKIK